MIIWKGIGNEQDGFNCNTVGNAGLAKRNRKRTATLETPILLWDHRRNKRVPSPRILSRAVSMDMELSIIKLKRLYQYCCLTGSK
jgi:hypothetical protein